MKYFKKIFFNTICIFFIINFSYHLCYEDEEKIIRIKHLQLTDQAYIPIKSGQRFTIELEGNITTGFSWFLDLPERLKETNIVIPTNLKENNTGDYYGNIPREDKIKLKVGENGIYHFKFLAGNDSGEEKITFVYKRPWTNDGKLQKSINVKIVNLNEKKDL